MEVTGGVPLTVHSAPQQQAQLPLAAVEMPPACCLPCQLGQMLQTRLLPASRQQPLQPPGSVCELGKLCGCCSSRQALQLQLLGPVLLGWASLAPLQTLYR